MYRIFRACNIASINHFDQDGLQLDVGFNQIQIGIVGNWQTVQFFHLVHNLPAFVALRIDIGYILGIMLFWVLNALIAETLP